jgi:hypothetical protein
MAKDTTDIVYLIIQWVFIIGLALLLIVAVDKAQESQKFFSFTVYKSGTNWTDTSCHYYEQTKENKDACKELVGVFMNGG